VTIVALSQRRTDESTRDVVPALTLFAVLLLLLPSRYVIGPLAAAGVPASLVALGIAVWWLVDWVGQPWPRSRLRQPTKLPALALLGAVLASYLAAAARPTSQDELLSADRGLLNILAWLGVLMAATDGISSRSNLDKLLRRVVWLGAVAASVGILQFVTKQPLIGFLQLPGLTDNGVDEGLLSRGGYLRPAGTATHPIEFGVSLSMLLPVALHLAVADAGRRRPVARWLPVGLIALALPISISRSAVICTAVALLLALPAWPAPVRRRVYAAALALVGCLAVALPGFVGGIVGLFTGISKDDSALSRTDSYAIAGSFISRAWLFGRGIGTWLPKYRILDNQYLGLLIEIGVVGTGCLVALLLVGVVTAYRAGRVPAAESAAHGVPAAPPCMPDDDRLGRALAAAVAAGSVSFAFFDALAFPMTPALLFLLLGCAGALRRITHERRTVGGDVRGAEAESVAEGVIPSRSARDRATS
jgi:polysaccharide biosynthesis protein PslJ